MGSRVLNFEEQTILWIDGDPTSLSPLSSLQPFYLCPLRHIIIWIGVWLCLFVSPLWSLWITLPSSPCLQHLRPMLARKLQQQLHICYIRELWPLCLWTLWQDLIMARGLHRSPTKVCWRKRTTYLARELWPLSLWIMWQDIIMARGLHRSTKISFGKRTTYLARGLQLCTWSLTRATQTLSMARERQLDIWARERQLDIHTREKQLGIWARERQLDIWARERQLDIWARERHLDIHTRGLQLNLWRLTRATQAYCGARDRQPDTHTRELQLYLK